MMKIKSFSCDPIKRLQTHRAASSSCFGLCRANTSNVEAALDPKASSIREPTHALQIQTSRAGLQVPS